MIEYVITIEYCRKLIRSALLVLLATTACNSCAGAKNIDDANVPLQAAIKADYKADVNQIDAILTRLDTKSRQIKTYEAKIIYVLRQPVLETETLREGILYYLNDANNSKLRINFTKELQDGDLSPNYHEEYLFDGVNLTRTQYKFKTVEYRQLTDANKPLNAFDLASRYLPIVGFTKTDKLREDFDISMPPAENSESKEYDQLLLKTLPQSSYKSDYTQTRFWINKRTSLPVRMEAVSPQDDIYDIKFENEKVNKSLPKGIFNIAVPPDFSKNIVPLEK